MEHCEMCCNTLLKEKFYQVGLEKFYKTYLDTNKYPVFYKHALSMVSLFGNTYTAWAQNWHRTFKDDGRVIREPNSYRDKAYWKEEKFIIKATLSLKKVSNFFSIFI